MNISHLSKMVDCRPMVDNIDPVAALISFFGEEAWTPNFCSLVLLS